MEFFLLVFACGLIQDCVRFPTTMGPLLLAHHAACLVGMLVARLAPGAEWASVFPWFFGGCTALEFGSGFNNIFWLRWLPQRLSELLYLSAMTVSNLVAIACVCAWVRTARWEKWHSGLRPWLGRLGAIYAGRHMRARCCPPGDPARVVRRDARLLPRRHRRARLPPAEGDAETVPGARAALARASRALRLNAVCCDSAYRVKTELSLSLSPSCSVRASASLSLPLSARHRALCTHPSVRISTHVFLKKL